MIEESYPEAQNGISNVDVSSKADLTERSQVAQLERAKALQELFIINSVGKVLQTGLEENLEQVRSGKPLPWDVVLIDTPRLTQVATLLEHESGNQIAIEYVPLDLPNKLTKKQKEDIKNDRTRSGKYEDIVSIVIYSPDEEQKTILQIRALFGKPTTLRIIGPRDVPQDLEHYERLDAGSLYLPEDLGYGLRDSTEEGIEAYELNTQRLKSIVALVKNAHPINSQIFDEWVSYKKEKYGVEEINKDHDWDEDY